MKVYAKLYFRMNKQLNVPMTEEGLIKKIFSTMRHRNMTYSELARISNVDRKTLYNIDKDNKCSLNTLAKIAKSLNLQISFNLEPIKTVPVIESN